MFSHNGRPLSAGEIKELYGISVRQLRSSEAVFRKEAFKRDKQRLNMVVQAIDNEKKHVERKWDSTRSRFVREHAELVYPPKTKVKYVKVGTVCSLPEGSIPPCIPFVGTFPPCRHPTKERRVSEMFKEPLFRHAVSYEAAEEDDLEQDEEETDRYPDNYSYYLANRRVSNSFSTSSFKPSGLTARSDGVCHQNSGAISSSHKYSDASVKNCTLQENTSSQMMSSKHSPCDRVQSRVQEHISNKRVNYQHMKLADRSHDVSGNKTEKLYQSSDVKNDSQSHSDENNFPDLGDNKCFVQRADPPMLNGWSGTTSRFNTKRKASWKNTQSSVEQTHNTLLVPWQRKTDRIKGVESQQNTKEINGGGHEQDTGSTPSGGDSPASRSDMTSESLNVELLQHALTDHSNQVLARNRWQRAVQRVIHLSTIFRDDKYVDDLQDGESFLGSCLSLGSISTPTTRTATDISENEHDVGMMVINIILQTFKELDRMELANLAEVWPIKMENFMTKIEDLIKSTGVEVMRIVETIQRGDLQDDKSAALLDWVRNIDSENVKPGSDRQLPLQPDEQNVNNTTNMQIVVDRTATATSSTLPLIEQQKETMNKRRPPQERSSTQGFRNTPEINIVPPSRRQSYAEDTGKGTGLSHSVNKVRPRTGNSVSVSSDKADKRYKVYRHDVAVTHHSQDATKGYPEQKKRPTASSQDRSEGLRRLSSAETHRAHSASSSRPGEARHIQDKLLAPNSRQRAHSWSKSPSTRSGFNKLGVHQYINRGACTDPLLTRRNSTETTRGRRLSPSITIPGNKSPEDWDQVEPLTKTGFGDPVTEAECLDTTETSMYTDRRGKTHWLIMRKAALKSGCRREANVTVMREDTVPLELCEPNEDKNTTENIKENLPKVCHDSPTIPEKVSPRSPSVEVEVSEDTPTKVHGTDRTDASNRSLPKGKSKDEKRLSATGFCQAPSGSRPEGAGDGSEEGEVLWKRRFSHPQCMTWVPELSTDLQGQGLALSVLHHKQGNCPKFRFTVLKVICVNIMRAAKNVYDAAAFFEMKKCRYLRMPFRHLSDVQRELSLNEIFS